MRYTALASIFLCLLASCSKEKTKADPKERPKIVLPVPSTMQMSQRTTAEIPGSAGRLLVTIGDITNRQVSVGISWKEGEPLVGTRSLQEGDALNLEIEDKQYRLLLKKLTNAIVGDDTADFLLEETKSPTDLPDQGILSKQEIDTLIRSLGELDGASFNRNGVEYSVQDAINHLSGKRSTAGSSIKTAEDFIELIGSKSSRSGEAYRMRLQNGTVITTHQWFTERLKEIRKNPNKTSFLTPDLPPVPAFMTATTSTHRRSLAPGQA